MRRTKEEAMQTRETILKAAAQIITRLGVNAFTIEAVAHEAGVTKGGVLHHFPSKEALLDGLIDQVMKSFRDRLTAAIEDEPAGQPGRWLRAYIRTIFSEDYAHQNLLPALAAAVSADHETLARIRRGMEESQMEATGDGLDPTTATIIRLAVDGFVFTKAFNVNVLDRETSQHVSDELLRLTSLVGIEP